MKLTFNQRQLEANYTAIAAINVVWRTKFQSFLIIVTIINILINFKNKVLLYKFLNKLM